MKVDRLSGQLDLLLLKVLSDGPAHGYGVILALRERSEGAFDLAEGSVYPALHRLELDQLVISSVLMVGGRRRRMYSLTDDGVSALETRRRDWHKLVTAVASVLEVPSVVTP